MATAKSKAHSRTAVVPNSSVFNVTAQQVSRLKGARAVATPRRDMVIIELNAQSSPAKTAKDQQAGTILPKVSNALSKPGLDRKRLFQTASGKVAYAYFVDPADPSRVLREDQSGKRTAGKVVNGTFRPIKA